MLFLLAKRSVTRAELFTFALASKELGDTESVEKTIPYNNGILFNEHPTTTGCPLNIFPCVKDEPNLTYASTITFGDVQWSFQWLFSEPLIIVEQWFFRGSSPFPSFLVDLPTTGSKFTLIMKIMMSTANASTSTRKALVLGLFKDTEDSILYTKSTREYLNANGGLEETFKRIQDKKFKQGSTRILYDQPGYDMLCLTHLGDANEGYNEMEDVDVKRENIRSAVAKSINALVDQSVTEVEVDCCGDPEAAAEGATLADYAYDDFKEVKKETIEVKPYNVSNNAAEQWRRGRYLAESQNFSRWLMESPANVMTPSKFVKCAEERLRKNCTVLAYDEDWIKGENMNSFYSVAQGSAEKPKFLVVNYNGDKSSDKHIALVGKGVTFDSGGISIKPSLNMDAMRADMGGAACVLAAVHGAASLGLAVNVSAYMPLTENMPSGTATKPGDVVRSRSGKTIQIDNTDAEGRLILADALDYACSKNPTCVVDLATLTGAMVVALGAGASGVFTNSTKLWTDLHESAKCTGDRVWRMPLYKLYTSQINKAPLADLNNIGGAGKGGAAVAAAFLQQFVKCDNWAHLDIAGVMSNTDQVPYLSKGMAGRPTRTLIEFLSKLELDKYKS